MKKDREMTTALVFQGIALICAILVFGGLAYYFNHWWIALFSILFSFSYKQETKSRDKEDAKDGQ